MHKRNRLAQSWLQKLVTRCTPGFSVFLATLLALPVNAGITLPTDPLTTASRVPPNILFILDNSGSMADTEMPDSVPATTTPNVATYAYTRNTLSYNPAITYQPWTKADGTLMTGGTSYGSVYSDLQYVPYSGTGPTGTGTITTTSANPSLYNSSPQTFYVPKDTANTNSTYLGAGTNYYRYQILASGRVQRGEYGTVVRSNEQAVTVSSGSASGTLTNNTAVTLTLASVTAGVTLDIVISNTTAQNRTLNYVVQNPAGVQLSNGNVTRGNSTTYTVTPTVSGAYKIVLTRASNNDTSYSVSASRYDSTNSCDGGVTSGSGWINCAYQTPTGRSEANELINYATWYSYHRTRTKAAKAGASAAFAELGGDIRVGFRTIWNDSNISSTYAVRNMPTPSVPIPVAYNDGLFSDTGTTSNANAYNNRTQWYNRLFTTTGNSTTPLRQSLTDAGAYFSDSSVTGPYGPAAVADQLACRQNFTILTTDGYWNESGYTNSTIGNADNTTSTNYTPTDPYRGGLASNGTPTLADVAMYYWKSDLRTDLRNIVPTNASDLASWQHMTTFTIGLGLVGTVDQNSVAAVLANGQATVNGVAGWPTPVNNTITAVDDLLHAAVNGHGTYVAANNPSQFTAGLKSALAAVTQRTGSFSNVAANSTQLDTETRVYQATYVSGVWTGELFAFPVTNNGVSATYDWRASAGIPTSGRKIFTYDGTAGASFPTAAQTTALARTSVPAVSGADNAAYLAGTRTLELQNGGALRNRNTLLGDIVSSSPAYDAETGTIYVGANDGMLHAFNTETGAEQFAFVPQGVNMSALGTLSDPSYSHRYFVDGPTVISTKAQTPGVNILAGSLGKGGKGVFALNVTDPANFSALNVKWEHNETPNGNMGLVQGKSIIAKLNDGTTALIVSNGINSSHDRAVLLVYNLDTGALLSEIDTGAGSAASPNGLAAPVGWDADANGTLDYIYAGDLLGNVWKFDLASTSTADWGVANSGAALFSATYGGVAQPITGGLTVALDPKTYKTWVFFGTGQMMVAGDLTSTAVQSMYGLIDAGAAIVRTDLTQRSTTVVGVVSGFPVRGFETNQALPVDSKGWYINLVKPPSATLEGERVVSDAQVVGNVLVMSSVIPTADACETDGKGYLNALDAFTGTSTSLLSSFFDLNGNGIFTDETLTDADGNTVPVGSINLGVGMPTMASLLRGLAVVGGSSGGTGSVKTDDPRNVGRVSWREVRGD